MNWHMICQLTRFVDVFFGHRFGVTELAVVIESLRERFPHSLPLEGSFITVESLECYLPRLAQYWRWMLSWECDTVPTIFLPVDSVMKM